MIKGMTFTSFVMYRSLKYTFKMELICDSYWNWLKRHLWCLKNANVLIFAKSLQQKEISLISLS